MSEKEARRNDRFVALALSAASEALAQAGWRPDTPEERDRTGVVIASGVGGWGAIEKAIQTTYNVGPDRLSPFTVPSFLANSAAAQVSIRHGFTGPMSTPVTACAAGLQALGDAARLIAAGEADVVVAGGTEASLGLVTQAGFSAARSLSSGFNDYPERSSRPFDTARDGFVPAEGAACLVLETLEHAQARGATILAEWLGYGTSSDAHHMTAAKPDGSGAAAAMQHALRRSMVETPDLVFAHATSTDVGDSAEAAAIAAVLKGKPTPITATKAATGHLLGAAGALAAVWAVCALRDQMAPPNRNLEVVDPALPPLELVGQEARTLNLATVLVNAFGFGGVNAAAVIARPRTAV